MKSTVGGVMIEMLLHQILHGEYLTFSQDFPQELSKRRGTGDGRHKTERCIGAWTGLYAYLKNIVAKYHHDASSLLICPDENCSYITKVS